MSKPDVKRPDLVYPELSYLIVGCAYDVFNELGAGHTERNYQKALSFLFNAKAIPFKEQVYYPLTFQNKIIAKNFLDYVVENKIVVELKKGDRFSKIHIEQVLNYLRISNLQLAILVNFTKTGVIFKRIVNVLIPNP